MNIVGIMIFFMVLLKNTDIISFKFFNLIKTHNALLRGEQRNTEVAAYHLRH